MQNWILRHILHFWAFFEPYQFEFDAEFESVEVVAKKLASEKLEGLEL
jgi:hypothetical protein